jgi:hypothetical protein
MADSVWSEGLDDSDDVSEIVASEEVSEGDSGLSGVSPSLRRSTMGLRRPPRFRTKEFSQVMEGLRRITWCVFPASLAQCLRDAARLADLDLSDRCGSCAAQCTATRTRLLQSVALVSVDHRAPCQ